MNRDHNCTGVGPRTGPDGRPGRLRAAARVGGRRSWSGWAGLGLLALLAGCTTPSERLDRMAAGLGFARLELEGEGYEHVAYFKPGREGAAGPAPLHVYLDGDGTPWVHGRWVATDPTPRNPLMLRLMVLDPAPALYLGRPCYNGLADHPPCTPLDWTHGRYSERVVRSMAAALGDFLDGRSYGGLVLLGHSGGGTLGMLLVPALGAGAGSRHPPVRAVVTMAANLDVDAWAALHGYTPLSGSLNPARMPPLPPRVRQIHLLGGEDRNVPPGLVVAALAQQPGSEVVIVDGLSHRLCWEQVWPMVLDAVSRQRPLAGVEAQPETTGREGPRVGHLRLDLPRPACSGHL